MPRIRILVTAFVAVGAIASSARAVGSLPDDTVWGPMRGASSLCHNVALQDVPSAAKARLNRASKTFHKADEFAVAGNYLKSFVKARDALAAMLPSRNVIQVGQVIFTAGTNVATAGKAVADCAIAEIAVDHPQEAADAQDLVDQADAARQDFNFAGAVALYRKAYKKVARFLPQ
jgi:hypothetical protein